MSLSRPFLFLAAVLCAAVAPAAAATPSASTAPAAAGTQSYSIAQLYTAAKPLPGVRYAKTYDRHAYVVTSSYRVLPEKLRRAWEHPRYGAQIRALLADDYFLRAGQFESFFAQNIGNIGKASFFSEGFVMLQLLNPEQVVIVPVSIATVQKADAAVRAALKESPELFRP